MSSFRDSSDDFFNNRGVGGGGSRPPPPPPPPPQQQQQRQRRQQPPPPPPPAAAAAQLQQQQQQQQQSHKQPSYSYYNTAGSSTSSSYHQPFQPQVVSQQPQQPQNNSDEWYTGDTTNSNTTPSNTTYTPMHSTSTTAHMTPQTFNPALSGPMTPSTFTPQPPTNTTPSSSNDPYANEPPLLEELGVNIPHIGAKARAVILPFSRKWSTIDDEKLMDDDDLAGPLVFALLLAFEMLLSGKLHFGYVYGFAVFGCVSMALLLNLMTSGDSGVSVWSVISILGYGLLPVNALAAVNAVKRVVDLNEVGVGLGVVVVGWCTVASTRLFERGFGLRDQRYLVGYPVALLYTSFVIITIF